MSATESNRPASENEHQAPPRPPVKSYGRSHNREPGIRCWCSQTHEPSPPAPPPPEVVEKAIVWIEESERHRRRLDGRPAGGMMPA